MYKNAMQKTAKLARAIQARGVAIDFDDAQTLRRAAMTLHRWAEGECGDSYGNLIERDEVTGKPFLTSDWGTRWGVVGRRVRRPIADREAGALRRVAEVCDKHGLYYRHQQDPRGCALFVDSEPIPNNDYTRGVACQR